MHLKLISSVSLGAFALCSPLAAQSLEENYATLCAEAKSSQNETCTALRQALMAKLESQEQSAQGIRKTPSPAAQIGSVWGAWADLADSTWLIGPEDDVIQYRWEEPGRVLLEDYAFKTGRTQRRVVIAPDGSGLVIRQGEKAIPLSMIADGEYAYFPTPEYPTFRVLTRIADGSLTTESQMLVGENWQPNGGPDLARTVWRPTESSAFAERVTVAENFERLIQDPAEIAKRWGIYAQLAGDTFMTKPFAGFRHIVSYRWVKPGQEMEMTTEMPDVTPPSKTTLPIVLDRSTGSLAFEYGPMKRIVEPNGAIRDETNIGNGTVNVKRLSMIGPGKYEETLHTVTNGKSKKISRAVFTSQSARNAKSGDGGLLGALIGAGVGAAVGTAAGLDAGATMEAMARGAAAASGNSSIQQGFAKGWAEETAKNDAMERSMEDAANAGLVAHTTQTSQSVRSSNYGSTDSAASQTAPTAAAYGSSNAVALVTKGFRVPITPNAASNEMCFAMIDLGPLTDDPDKSYSARRIAVDQYLDQFLANCSALGELGNGHSFNDIHFDDKAETYYGQFRANRWMHEVEM